MGIGDKILKYNVYFQECRSQFGQKMTVQATVVIRCSSESILDGLRNDFRKVEVCLVGVRKLENLL